MEVNALDVGVRAVLSQRSLENGRLYRCAFLSKKLSKSEKNYDNGNSELLAVKVTLEEWNLEYLQTAKHLDSHQTRWALFFNCFHFHLSYRPSSKNTKPDTLSRIHSPDPVSKSSEYILRRTCALVCVKVRDRRTGQTGAKWDSYSQWLSFKQTVCGVKFKTACHPGIKITLFPITQRVGSPETSLPQPPQVSPSPIVYTATNLPCSPPGRERLEFHQQWLWLKGGPRPGSVPWRLCPNIKG